MFGNFYLMKNHKIAHNSTTIEARRKNKHSFGILFDIFVWFTKIKIYLPLSYFYGSVVKIIFTHFTGLLVKTIKRGAVVKIKEIVICAKIGLIHSKSWGSTPTLA